MGNYKRNCIVINSDQKTKHVLSNSEEANTLFDFIYIPDYDQFVETYNNNRAVQLIIIHDTLKKTGAEIIAEIKDTRPAADVIVIQNETESMETLVKIMKLGAYDCIPTNRIEQLLAPLKSSYENFLPHNLQKNMLHYYLSSRHLVKEKLYTEKWLNKHGFKNFDEAVEKEVTEGQYPDLTATEKEEVNALVEDYIKMEVKKFYGSKKPVILIVDDEANIRKQFQQHLNPIYDTILASDGDEALKLLNEIKVNIILLDVVMPEIKGDDLIQKFQGIAPWIEIIMITAEEDKALATRTFMRGVRSFMNKPVEKDELNKQVFQALTAQYHSETYFEAKMLATST